jgi:hypothetical protein
MKLQHALTLGVWLMVGCLASPVDAQRRREPDSQGSSEARTAQERPRADGDTGRTAQERPTAPKQDSRADDGAAKQEQARTFKPPPPATAPSDNGRNDRERPRAGSGDRDHDRARNRDDERDRPSGGVVINPVVIRPVTVGSFQVGSATVVGQPVVVGHPSLKPNQSDHDSRRPGRESSRRGSPYVVFVDGGTEVISTNSVTYVEQSDETVSPVQTITRRQGEPFREQRTPRPSYYTFTTWYPVTSRITVGLPVLYPLQYENAYDKDLASTALTAADSVSALERGVPLIPYAMGTYGGISFDISPFETAVYVDGYFVGTVDDYSPSGPPLPLPVGNHKVELRGKGFRTESFVLFVTIGEVTPLSGSLEPAER